VVPHVCFFFSYWDFYFRWVGANLGRTVLLSNGRVNAKKDLTTDSEENCCCCWCCVGVKDQHGAKIDLFPIWDSFALNNGAN
jgi:hypothetical protein